MTKVAKNLLERTPAGYPKKNRAFAAAAKKVIKRRAADVARVERYRSAMEQQLREREAARGE